MYIKLRKVFVHTLLNHPVFEKIINLNNNAEKKLLFLSLNNAMHKSY